MSTLEKSIATLPELAISSHDALAFLRRHSRLRPLLLEVLAERVTVQAARAAGLTASNQELQQAADRFRQRHGLRKTEDTDRWLQHNGMRLADLEVLLEDALLVDKFRRHFAAGRVEERFVGEPARYARARISHFTVTSEGLARELLARVQDDGADFADLAREHAQVGATRNTEVMRAELPPSVADAVFQARADATVGPLPSRVGWLLIHVHELLPPQLDEGTCNRIRGELFSGWLEQQLAAVQIDLSLLDQP